MKKFIHKYRSSIATIGGLLVSLGSAWAVIDFNTFSLQRDLFKLIVLSLPAVGGYLSHIDIKDPKDGI